MAGRIVLDSQERLCPMWQEMAGRIVFDDQEKLQHESSSMGILKYCQQSFFKQTYKSRLHIEDSMDTDNTSASKSSEGHFVRVKIEKLKELLKFPDIYDRLTISLALNIWELYGVKMGLLCHGLDLLDLNEVPFDLNEDAGIIPPNFFTQLMDEAIDKYPQPPMNGHAPVVNVEADATNTYASPFVAPIDSTSIAQDANEDEASSQPNYPHVGMRYDTLEGAKEHYNAHVARKGFSVKINTKKRSASTGKKQKQQFSCNKFRKSRKDNGGAGMQVDVGSIPNSVSADEVDIENAELASIVADIASQGPKEKEPKKRKRENIVHTYCKAKMVVKLMDGRWEVIHFVPEHNHPLVQKPSLIKYLRLHQGIPKEERDVVKNLHSTNLPAGKMMDIMSEFYGSELLVPYTTKAITNYYATLTRKETKDGNMAEVVSYFVEQKEKDLDFLF
ncbi:hypothetical protein ACQ4PT_020432 [Festuca glaucescens]